MASLSRRSATARDPAMLCEIIVHGASHAMEVLAGPNPYSAFSRSLVDVPPQLQQVAHVRIFMTAAEAVRRFFAPDHPDYGDARAYDAQGPGSVEIARPPWRRRLAGRLSLGVALAAMKDRI